jgi:radical SAM protein with 4Fe4S-binding SPASM domain
MTAAYTTERRPLVLVQQFFGATVFDRRTSRYLPFDHEATGLLRRMRDTTFDQVHAEWSAAQNRERVTALERFFEQFADLGFFTIDRRFAGDVLSAEPAADHLTGPLAVHLEVVSACNLTCTHCFAGDLPRRERRLSMPQLDSLFAQMAAIGSFRLGLTGGEPLLRRDLFEIIDLATGHGLHPCVTTNGLLINKEIARGFGSRDLVWLNVSLEGATARSNDAVRGEGTFERVLDRLAILRRYARFTLAFTITSGNASEVEECAALAERVGASTAVFRPLYPVGVARRHLDLMPTFEQYSDALGRLAMGGSPTGYDVRHVDPFSPATRDETQPVTYTNLGCGAGNLVCSISVSGNINPCSFLGPSFNAGNVGEQSLAALWHDSAGFRQMRSLPGGNPCGGCPSHDHEGGEGHFTGGCRARALVLNGSVNAPDPWVTDGAKAGGSHRRLLPLVTLELSRDTR